MRQIDNIVTIGVIVQSPLDSFGIVSLTIALCIVRVFGHIDDIRCHGEFHLGNYGNRKKDNKIK